MIPFAYWRKPVTPLQTLWAWGADNSYGELGNNSFSGDGLYVSPVQIAGSWVAVTGTTMSNSLNNAMGAAAGIRPDGSLWTWGANYSGNLGPQIPFLQQASSPLQIAGTWTKVSLGNWSGSLGAVRNDGTLWVLGDNYWGECGQGSTTYPVYSSPVQVGGATTWNNVVTGIGYWLATQSNGTLWACGANTYGEINSTRNAYSSAVQILTGFSWVQIGTASSASYENTSYGIRSDGTLWGWGSNGVGQLCKGTATHAYSSPVQIAGSWAQVVGGTLDFALGIQTGGTLWSWGYNATGQLGHNNVTNKSSPIQIGSALWTQVTAGNGFVAGIQSNGTLWSWGNNSSGQLGNGGYTNTSSPIQVAGSWTQVSAGYNSIIGMHTDGTVWGWGDNATFELGMGQGGFPSGNTSTYPSPIQLAGSWNQISCSGASGSSVANGYGMGLKIDGTLWGWGDNSWGQLGQPLSSCANYSPIQIAGSWSQVSAGGYTWQGFVLASKVGGSLWAWGSNTIGQLGNGNLVSTTSPVLIDSGSWTQFSASTGHWLAIRGDGTLWGSGDNSGGELGQGTSGVSYSSPVQVSVGSWLQVSAGYDGPLYGTSLMIRADGTLWALGSNSYGEIGNGTITNYSSPVQVTGSWTQTAAGLNGSSFGIRTDGSLWAWGNNGSGQLGVGNITNYSSPVMISSGPWSKVWAGPGTTYAMTPNGTYYGWGGSGWGNWGGGWANQGSGACSSPVQVSGTWVTVSVLGSVGGFGIRSS